MTGRNPLPLLDILQPLLAAGTKSRYAPGNRTPRMPESNVDFSNLVTLLVTVLLLGLIAWIAGRLYAIWQQRVINSPRKLFRELCLAHGLVTADRQLLREIARWHALPDPVQLFFEPDRFRSAEMRSALECESAAIDLEARLFGIAGT